MPEVPNNFELSRTLIAQLLDVRGPPFRLSINHNVGPPHNQACPLPYDWRHGQKVGVTTNYRDAARNWISGALVYGYHIERLDRYGWNVLETVHLRSARGQAIRLAERAAMTPAQRQKEDDEIPF